MQVPGTKDAKDQLGDGPIQNQDSHDRFQSTGTAGVLGSTLLASSTAGRCAALSLNRTLISLWMFCRSSMLVTLAFDIVLHAYTCMPCSHPRSWGLAATADRALME